MTDAGLECGVCAVGGVSSNHTVQHSMLAAGNTPEGAGNAACEGAARGECAGACSLGWVACLGGEALGL
jgi:hypothetical protein